MWTQESARHDAQNAEEKALQACKSFILGGVLIRFIRRIRQRTIKIGEGKKGASLLQHFEKKSA